MKRHVSAAVIVVIAALAVTAAAVAAVAPGTYKGHLYTGATKVATSPATVAVTGTKVTIKVAKFPIKCLGPSGKFDAPSAPMKYEFKGTLKGNSVSGQYVNPLGGTGEYFTAKGTFAPATKTFTGKLSFVGRCQGTSSVRAKKA